MRTMIITVKGTTKLAISAREVRPIRSTGSFQAGSWQKPGLPHKWSNGKCVRISRSSWGLHVRKQNA